MKDFDIELPPIPTGSSFRDTLAARNYAKAAVLADRERRSKPVAYLEIRESGTGHKTGLYRDAGRKLPIGFYALYTSPPLPEPDVLPGEAIFGFAAWLTCLKTPVTFSECHSAALGADLAAAYNASQGFDQVREDFHKRLNPGPSEPAKPYHPDDAAVDATAVVMKEKLALKRSEGRKGWQEMSAAELSALLHELVEKGDPLDVAIVAMMLHQNRQSIEVGQKGFSIAEAKHILGLPDLIHRVDLGKGLSVMGDRESINKVKDLARDVVDHGKSRTDSGVRGESGGLLGEVVDRGKPIDRIKNEIAALLDEAGRQGVKIHCIEGQFASTVCGQFRLISMDVDEHRLGTGKKGEDS